jgi:cytochrome b561
MSAYSTLAFAVLCLLLACAAAPAACLAWELLPWRRAAVVHMLLYVVALALFAAGAAGFWAVADAAWGRVMP